VVWLNSLVDRLQLGMVIGVIREAYGKCSASEDQYSGEGALCWPKTEAVEFGIVTQSLVGKTLKCQMLLKEVS